MESEGNSKKRYVLEEVPETGTESTRLNTHNLSHVITDNEKENDSMVVELHGAHGSVVSSSVSHR